jgi:hypothetical protein
MWLDKLGKLKTFNDLIGSRTLDLPIFLLVAYCLSQLHYRPASDPLNWDYILWDKAIAA